MYYDEENNGLDPLPDNDMMDSTTGFGDGRMGPKPMFSLEPVHYTPPADVVHMVVSNNMVCMGLTDNTIKKIDLESPAAIDDIELTKKVGERIYKLFLDPTGRHLIASMESGDNYYVYAKKCKLLSRMKGHVLESIAFNRAEGTRTSTSQILIGTTGGKIFEAEIERNDGGFFQGVSEKYFKQVYDLELNEPVCGLRMEPFSSAKNDKKYFIMAATKTRMYQFIGDIVPDYPPIFLPIFSQYITNRVFQEIPGELDQTELNVFCKFQGLPKSFAWLTGAGMYHGNLFFGSQNSGESVATDAGLIPYPQNDGDHDPPYSFVSTEFHFLMLQTERLVAVCSLDEKIAFSEVLPYREYGEIIGLTMDQTKNTIWAFSATSIFEIIVHDETRNVWKIYLDKQQYDTAAQYCKDKPEQADKVLTCQAHHYFEKGRYQLAADYYARTTASFEEVALRFIERGEKDAVKIYLTKKLQGLKPNELPQITMLSSWLIEIYLNHLDELEDSGDSDAEAAQSEEFRRFLADYGVKVNHATVYELINSHGRVEDAVYYATLINDYERVINYNVTRGEYEEALKVISKQNNIDFYYKFASVLLVNAPEKTVQAWMCNSSLDPKQFLNALARYATTFPDVTYSKHCGLRYLEYCVQEVRIEDSAVQNYFISLLISANADERLLSFLDESEYYDKQYALRLCTQAKKQRACVHIYNLMGLYEEALEISLLIDVELAKMTASIPYEDETRSRKLWLRIARHIIEKENDVATAMQFLEPPSLLKIEDILPFFPDFVTIDHFKDAICQSLQTYNQHIEQLKAQMQEATISAKLIRKDVQDLKNKYGVILPNSKCALCKQSLLTRQFYMFPCQHLFHSDCLSRELLPHLPVTTKKKLTALLRQIGTNTMPSDPHFGEDTTSICVPEIDKPRAELDELLSGECVLCGMVMIKSIDEPFIREDELDELKKWEL